MQPRSNSSRERILENAEAIILQKGFSATSIEDIMEKSAITKGGFFYHFDSKATLARALIQRYLQQDDEVFNSLGEKANDLSEDPLHQLLIFLKLLAEMMGQMEDTHPGCLVASFTYENQQFQDDIKDLMRQGIISWREMMVKRFDAINEKYDVEVTVDKETLADMFTAIVEGGILLARNFKNNQLLVDQIMAYRTFIRSIYGAL